MITQLLLYFVFKILQNSVHFYPFVVWCGIFYVVFFVFFKIHSSNIVMYRGIFFFFLELICEIGTWTSLIFLFLFNSVFNYLSSFIPTLVSIYFTFDLIVTFSSCFVSLQKSFLFILIVESRSDSFFSLVSLFILVCTFFSVIFTIVSLCFLVFSDDMY